MLRIPFVGKEDSTRFEVSGRSFFMGFYVFTTLVELGPGVETFETKPRNRDETWVSSRDPGFAKPSKPNPNP